MTNRLKVLDGGEDYQSKGDLSWASASYLKLSGAPGTEKAHEPVVGGDEPDGDTPPPASKARVHMFRISKTGFLTLTLLVRSVYVNVLGPALPDLRARLGLTVEEVARASSWHSIGAIFGGLGAGLLNDRFSKYTDLVLAVAMVLSGVFVIVKPWCYDVLILAIMYFMEGLTGGANDPVASYSVINLWGKRADTPLYVFHFGWVAGNFLAPLLCVPFVSHPEDILLTSNLTNLTDAANVTMATIPGIATGGSIQYVYVIAGILPILLAGVFAAYYYFGFPDGFQLAFRPRHSMREVLSPRVCGYGHAYFATVIVTMVTLLYMCIRGITSIFKFQYSFLTESHLALSASDAMRVEMANRAAGMAARAVVIFISPFVPAQIMLMVSAHLTLVALGGTAIWGTTDMRYFWIFSIMMSAISGSLWPAVKVWASKYIMVTSFVVAITTVGTSMGQFAVDWIQGYVYQHIRPAAVYYVAFICTIFFVIIVIINQIIASCHVRRLAKLEKEKEAEEQGEKGETGSMLQSNGNVEGKTNPRS